MENMQAIIFAAGLGTRLKPLTDTMPKALLNVGGEPLLKHVIMNLRNAGFSNVVVNVHHFSSQIIDYLRANGNFDLDISISDETSGLLDTGGGIKKAAPMFANDKPILIHNVDILSNVDLKSFYASGNLAAAMLLVSRRKTKRYLLFDEDMRLVGWTNTETGEVRSPYPEIKNLAKRNAEHVIESAGLTMLAFSGIHTFSPSLFSLMNDLPDKFGIMDFYLSVCDKVVIKGYVKEDLKLMDVGKIETLCEAEYFLAKLR